MPFYLLFYFFLEKIELDISCESRQMTQMKCQILNSLTNNIIKRIRISSASVLKCLTMFLFYR